MVSVNQYPHLQKGKKRWGAFELKIPHGTPVIGAEILEMHATALNRVLSVWRLPKGSLYLRGRGLNGGALVAAEGLSNGFHASMKNGGLHEYLAKLVARLGGLLILRELNRDALWMALEREDAFKKIRESLLNEGLRTLVGISIQSREQVFGLMLLGDTKKRQFTPAELHLLLILGQQIGMAIETSDLAKQSKTRNENIQLLGRTPAASHNALAH